MYVVIKERKPWKRERQDFLKCNSRNTQSGSVITENGGVGNENEDKTQGGLGVGGIIAIILGIAAIFVGGGFVVYYFIIRKRKI